MESRKRHAARPLRAAEPAPTTRIQRDRMTPYRLRQRHLDARRCRLGYRDVDDAEQRRDVDQVVELEATGCDRVVEFDRGGIRPVCNQTASEPARAGQELFGANLKRSQEAHPPSPSGKARLAPP